MSRRNVERAQRLFDVLNRRDFTGYLSRVHPAVEVVGFPTPQGQRSYRGLLGACDWWRDLTSAVPDYRLELLEAREVGDFVVAKVRARARRFGRTTPFETAMWLAIEWNRGRLLWWRSFGTEREAVDAARALE